MREIKSRLYKVVKTMIETLETYQDDPKWSVGDWMREEQTFKDVVIILESIEFLEFCTENNPEMKLLDRLFDDEIPFDGTTPNLDNDDYQDDLEQAFSMDRGTF